MMESIDDNVLYLYRLSAMFEDNEMYAIFMNRETAEKVEHNIKEFPVLAQQRERVADYLMANIERRDLYNDAYYIEDLIMLVLCMTDRMRASVEQGFSEDKGAMQNLRRIFNNEHTIISNALKKLTPRDVDICTKTIAMFAEPGDSTIDLKPRNLYGLAMLCREGCPDIYARLKKLKNDAVDRADIVIPKEERNQPLSLRNIILRETAFRYIGYTFDIFAKVYGKGVPYEIIIDDLIIMAREKFERAVQIPELERSEMDTDEAEEEDSQDSLAFRYAKEDPAGAIGIIFDSSDFQDIYSRMKEESVRCEEAVVTSERIKDMFVSLFESGERVPYSRVDDAILDIMNEVEMIETSKVGQYILNKEMASASDNLYITFESDECYVTAKDALVAIRHAVDWEGERKGCKHKKAGKESAIGKMIATPTTAEFLTRIASALFTAALCHQTELVSLEAAKHFGPEELFREEQENEIQRELNAKIEAYARDLEELKDSNAQYEKKVREEAREALGQHEKRLSKATHETESLKKQIAGLKEENRKLEQRLKAEREQSEELLNLLEEHEEEEEDTAINLSRLKELRYCFVGGHYDTLRELRKTLPETVEYQTNAKPTATDLMVIFTDWISHPLFYSATTYARKNNIPYIYISKTKNYDKCLLQIYNAVSALNK